MKYLIIEDEMAASARLSRMVSALRADAVCLAELRGVEDAVQWLGTHGQSTVDVAFVDIQLSDGISFELFELVNIQFPVIFTTAYDHYVLRVFQVHTIDYLLKPIKLGQLSDALARLERFGRKPELRAIQAAIASIPAATARQRFVVKAGQTIKVVHASDVSYFYSEHKITYLVCFDGRRYAVEFTLDQLETSLHPLEFHRANRQFIVSISGISEMHAYSRSRLKLILTPKAAQDVIVSTEKASIFKEWLQGNTPA